MITLCQLFSSCKPVFSFQILTAFILLVLLTMQGSLGHINLTTLSAHHVLGESMFSDKHTTLGDVWAQQIFPHLG